MSVLLYLLCSHRCIHSPGSPQTACEREGCLHQSWSLSSVSSFGKCQNNLERWAVAGISGRCEIQEWHGRSAATIPEPLKQWPVLGHSSLETFQARRFHTDRSPPRPPTAAVIAGRSPAARQHCSATDVSFHIRPRRQQSAQLVEGLRHSYRLVRSPEASTDRLLFPPSARLEAATLQQWCPAQHSNPRPGQSGRSHQGSGAPGPACAGGHLAPASRRSRWQTEDPTRPCGADIMTRPALSGKQSSGQTSQGCREAAGEWVPHRCVFQPHWCGVNGTVGLGLARWQPAPHQQPLIPQPHPIWSPGHTGECRDAQDPSHSLLEEPQDPQNLDHWHDEQQSAAGGGEPWGTPSLQEQQNRNREEKEGDEVEEGGRNGRKCRKSWKLKQWGERKRKRVSHSGHKVWKATKLSSHSHNNHPPSSDNRDNRSLLCFREETKASSSCRVHDWGFSDHKKTHTHPVSPIVDHSPACLTF